MLSISAGQEEVAVGQKRFMGNSKAKNRNL